MDNVYVEQISTVGTVLAAYQHTGCRLLKVPLEQIYRYCTEGSTIPMIDESQYAINATVEEYRVYMHF